MNVLITICGRGGSKGVKNKNIKELNGIPLIAYSINVAKKWNKAKRIICSTDSKDIAVIAEKYGAEVPFIRPNDLSSDNSGKVDVIRHAMIESEKIYDEQYDAVIDLDITNPIRKEKDIDNCFESFKRNNPEVLFSVVKSKKNPYFNMVELNQNGFVEICKKSKTKILRRQDEPIVYTINCSIYIYSREFLLNKENNSILSSKKAMIYEMDPLSSNDIDSELDFKFIEYLIKNKEVSL